MKYSGTGNIKDRNSPIDTVVIPGYLTISADFKAGVMQIECPKFAAQNLYLSIFV